MSNRTYTSALNDGKGAPAFMYIYDASLVTTGAGRLYTGANRLYTTADISNSTVNVSGLSLSVGSVAVTGGQLTVTNGNITVVNPLLATSGNSTILNTSPIPVSGVVVANTVDTGVRAVNIVASITQAIVNSGGYVGLTGAPTVTVTGTQVSVLGTPSVSLAGNPQVGVSGGTLNVSVTGGVLTSSSSSTFLTGNTLVGITGGTLNVTVTGGVLSASSSSIALTGFSPTLPPLPVSGVFNAAVTVNAVAITGNPVVTITGVLATTASLSVANVTVTGFPATIAPLAISGIVTASVSTVDTGNRSVFLVNQAVVNSGGWVGLTGVLAVVNSGGFIGVTGTVTTNSNITNTAPLAITGIVTANTVDTGIRAVNIVSSITQATFVSGGFLAITGDQRNVVISGGFLAVTGVHVVQLTGNTPVSLTNQAVVNSGGWVGITGFSSLIAPLAVSGVFSATTDNTTVVLAIASGNALLLTANVIGSGVSGQLAANLAGSAPVTGDIRNIPGTILNVSGYVTTILTGAAISATVPNPLGITGVAKDVNPIYSGVNTYNFLPIGGRAVAATGVGSVTGYTSGAFVMMNFDANNGALMVEQGLSDKNFDTIQVFTAGSGLALASGITGSTGSAGVNFGVVLSANPSRLGWGIQNLGTGAIMMAFSTNIASTGNLNMVLKGSSAPFIGDGASFVDQPAVWKGPVSVSGYNGAMALYTKWEI